MAAMVATAAMSVNALHAVSVDVTPADQACVGNGQLESSHDLSDIGRAGVGAAS
jgi:hypothetical protein